MTTSPHPAERHRIITRLSQLMETAASSGTIMHDDYFTDDEPVYCERRPSFGIWQGGTK